MHNSFTDGQFNNPNFYVSTPLPGTSQTPPPLSPQTPLHYGTDKFLLLILKIRIFY